MDKFFQRVAIIGSGAVGGYYGSLLARAGHEVHFLLRSDYEQVTKQGFKILSPKGDFEVSQVNTWNDAEAMPQCDLVIIAMKTVSNELLLKLVKPVAKKGAFVLNLQNGLGTEEAIQDALPQCKIFAGLCFLCCFREAPGLIRHHDYGLIRLAQYAAGEASGISEDLQRLSAFLDSAAIETAISPWHWQARWEKLVWNMCFNGLCTILQQDTAQILATDKGRQLTQSLMQEIVAGANSCGCKISTDFIEQMMQLTLNMKPYQPSMYLDRQQGRRMEVDDIYHRPILFAQEQGFDMSACRLLAHQLDLLQP